jgi:hypothetical protein
MHKRIGFIILLIGIVLFFPGIKKDIFAASTPAAVEYLCDVGVELCNQGKLDEALHEFEKVLILDPGNQIATKYVNDIRSQESPVEVLSSEETPPPKKIAISKVNLEPEGKTARDTAMDKALLSPSEINKKVEKKQSFVEPVDKQARGIISPAGKPKKIFSREEAMNDALMSGKVLPQQKSIAAESLMTPQKRIAEPEPIKSSSARRAGVSKSEEITEESIAQRKPIDRYIVEKVKDKTGLKVSGKAQASFGVASPDEFIWKRANYDLNDKYKSWRLTSDAGFNRRFNTYDPRIYDSLDLNLDTENKEGFNFHTDITVDPWSFVGKSDKITVTGSNGDAAEVQLYYWSNTGYTVNNTAYTKLKGDTISIPELKVKSGEADSFTATSSRDSSVTFNVPSLKIYRQFQPLRELWLDYTNDQLKIRAFPIGYQDQAYTSDDPLGITNHRIWWQDSLWLRRYTPGNYNSLDTTTPTYTKGRWDDTFSFLTKDSAGKYLTALRGIAFNMQPQEQTSFDTTIATPKDLWQEYSNVDNIIAAARLKHYLKDNFMLGATFSSRSGFITESTQSLDSQNFVFGMDLGYEITNGMKAQGEVLSSRSFYDTKNDDYETDSRGNAYYFSFITRYPQESIMGLKYGYDEIEMKKEEDVLAKSKFYLVRMDKGFDSALSNFHNTRQDVFWSRHIHFHKSLSYYDSGLDGATTNWDELNATRIGDGIDIGRDVLGFRFEFILRDKFSNLFDVRNVHDSRGKFVENVARDEVMVKLTDKLTAKGFGLYQKMPRTQAGIDPFIYDGNTGESFINSAVKDGDNASLKTGSLGLNYDFFEWLSVNGIYERSNDYSLAYGDFPRDIFRNDTTLWRTNYENNKLYRSLYPFLYYQNYFPQAPYSFYNVFKCGLRLLPIDNMEIYLDYARNEFEAASYNSDNMNHVGLEIGYMPTAKLGMAFKYIYSRSQDMNRITTGADDLVTAHNNFFAEFRYLPSKDNEFILQYGEGNTSNLGNMVLDPYGGSLLTLDTQHITRLYYRRKF